MAAAVQGKGGDDLSKIAAPAQRALAAQGYTRLDQLTEVSEKEIAQLHGMGPKALGILRAALAVRGLAFASGQTETVVPAQRTGRNIRRVDR